MWVGPSAMWEKVAGTPKEVALRRASKQSPARVCFSVWCLPVTIIAEPGVEIAEEDESCEGMPASCHSSGEAAVGVDLFIVHVRVRLVEEEARGDRPASGGAFRQRGWKDARPPASGRSRCDPISAPNDSDGGPAAVVVAGRTVSVGVELVASWYEGQGNR